MADVADPDNSRPTRPSSPSQSAPSKPREESGAGILAPKISKGRGRSRKTADKSTESPPAKRGEDSINVGADNNETSNSFANDLVANELAARSSRWPWLLAGLVIGGLAVWGVSELIERRTNEADDVEVEQVELAVAEVERRDLLEQVDWVGTLSYGELVDVVGTGGTITGASANGATLNRGDVIASIDEEPVVVVFGDRPLWRPLRSGVEGVDVKLIETNLVALGYDPDVTITIDEEFTANTGEMIERWQEDLGREVTGTVEPNDVVVVSGPSVITSPANVGSAASGPMAGISSQRQVTDVVSALSGVVTNRAPIDSPIEHGTVLYELDELAVIALTPTATESDPVARALTAQTFTYEELEQALADEGYDPDEAMTIDGTVTEATNAAITAWQSSTGLPETGLADPGYYLSVPANRVVESHAEGDRLVLTASTSELEVSVVVAVADADEFEVGDEVTIELADETTVDGRVAEIGAVEESPDPEGGSTVTISIEVLGTGELIEGVVTVSTIGEAVEGAIAVPTRALVALREGGFAVEIIDSSGDRKLTGVEIGAFDEGYVEITEGDLEPGDQIAVPQ